MQGQILEANNKFSQGHEQQSKRPYLIINKNDEFALGFCVTTKNKRQKDYLSHKNLKLGTCEVMLNQLQVLSKDDFSHKQPYSKVVSDFKYGIVAEDFISQIIHNKAFEIHDKSCSKFTDIINFTHNFPKFSHINEWLIVSQTHFNAFSKMCFIVPNTDVRKVQILRHKNFTNDEILGFKQNIRQVFGVK